MDVHPYLQAFNRIRAELLEMPGVTLTPEQVRRLCGVDLSICEGVLNDLVRARFLASDGDGNYRRMSHPSRPQCERTDRHPAPGQDSPTLHVVDTVPCPRCDSEMIATVRIAQAAQLKVRADRPPGPTLRLAVWRCVTCGVESPRFN